MKQNWTTQKLGDLFEFKYGKGLTSEHRQVDGSVKVYGSNGIIGRHDNSLSKGPTIVVGRKGSVGEINFSPYACWPIDTTYYIDAFPAGFPPKYWALYLKSLRLGSHDKSSAIPGVSRKDIYCIDVPVPPPTEQHRIVAKLEKLLTKVEACQERLDKIPTILKRFRQSVLAAACSGRLTADWRDDDSYAEDLPANWRRVPLAELIPPRGIFDGPFGSNLKTSDYTASGVRVIRLENVGHLRFISEKETYVSCEKYETLKKHTVRENDIIFASFIGEEIRACLLPKLETTAIAKADCFCLRPRLESVDRHYLTYQLVSSESYKQLLEDIHGVTRPRINVTQLRKLEVKVCPLPEQHKIIRRIEALFKIADQIEERFKKAKAYVDKLTQSILAKAFRGELVPQDLNDETSSYLLKRIQEKKGSETKKKLRNKSKEA